MTADEVALAALGRRAEGDAVALAGSASGSGVYRVRIDGRPAVLKVTTASGPRADSRRELAFYRTRAHEVPVRTPELIDHVDTDEVTALVLSAHTPAPPARLWDRPAWLQVGRELAMLHAIPPEAGAGEPWIRRVLQHPPLDVAERFWSRTAAAGLLDRVLSAPQMLADGLDAVPAGFVHGDCHVQNLLYDGDQLVWTDWQVYGTGSPAVDLAFLWGRAHADSADPPREEMVREYTAHRRLDSAAFERALLSAELGTLLFGWPEYAALHDRSEQDRMTGRLIYLIGAWGA